MSTPTIPTPVKLVISIIFRSDEQGNESPELKKTINALIKEFGAIDIQSPIRPFSRTTYYNPEMGDNLWRLLISFERLVERDSLADAKLFTNELEKEVSDADGRRKINIDPGLLSLENLILASGKNFTHRIYLKKGIFAEVTLLFQNKQFNNLLWTYPDYGSDEFKAILMEMRGRLLAVQ